MNNHLVDGSSLLLAVLQDNRFTDDEILVYFNQVLPPIYDHSKNHWGENKALAEEERDDTGSSCEESGYSIPDLG